MIRLAELAGNFVTGPSDLTPTITQTIAHTISQLRQFTQTPLQSTWRMCLEDLPIAQACERSQWPTWQSVTLNAKEHIAWLKGQQVMWLAQELVVPQGEYDVAGLTWRVALTWWAEDAQIFVNGQLVQTGDLFDCVTRILLKEAVQIGDRVAIAIRLVSPGHDDGALVKSVGLFERLDGLPEPSFIADELAVVQAFVERFEPERLEELGAIADLIHWNGNREELDDSLEQVRSHLGEFSGWIKERSLKLVGHAHLDMAWLWSVPETWKAAERTFESVLNLQKDFPELIFCHSTPALYEWMEIHRPDLFEHIRSRVAEGRWEAIGAMWIEPELNLVSAEAIARHLLYGQHYFQEKFGTINRIAWLPDTFGFNWQLPQLLKLGGVDYFVTQKLRWNDTTQFPHDLFQWQAPDGTQVVSLMSAPIGEGIDPVKMANYAIEWESKTGESVSLWLPGVGDHGGGPTRDMLEVARRWERSPVFPNLEFTSAIGFLEQLDSAELPVWNDELYLEFHRGCYTTHADQKQLNQECQTLLFHAEWLSAIATIIADEPYPKDEIETAWKQVLFNQFHDILPGTSIPEVFVDANREWATAKQSATQIMESAIAAITPKQPAIEIASTQTKPTSVGSPEPGEVDSLSLENDYLKVIINPRGEIDRLYDKQNHREVFSQPGNQLQVFADSGQYWDAWNIDPNYADRRLDDSEWIVTNKTRSHDSIQITRTLRSSRFIQTYHLAPNSPILKITTTVDWQDRHLLVKAAFPFTIAADSVTYEIPGGAIERTTRPETDREQAQWEVPALNWADFSNGEYGVSVLTDYKHGFDAQPNQLRLTLLRGATWPDPEADRTEHTFTYALYPHQGDWKTARTAHHAKTLQFEPPLSYRQFFDLGADNLLLMAFKQSETDPNEYVLRVYEAYGESAILQFTSPIGLRLIEAIDLLEHPTSEPKIDGQTVAIDPWKIVSFRVKVS